MDDEYKLRGRSRRKSQGITNLHHFRYELFNNIIGMQLIELDHFTETSTKLLLCVTYLNPSDSFSAFNKEKLIRLALFYPSEFSIVDLMVLGDQLDTYIIDLRGGDEFSGIEGIASFAEKMVKTKKNLIFPLDICLSNCHYFYQLQLLQWRLNTINLICFYYRLIIFLICAALDIVFFLLFYSINLICFYFYYHLIE